MGLAFEANDAFEAASWLDGGWNSSAKAVTADLVEWKYRAWGSGRGHGYWSEVATFGLVAEMFGLKTTRDYDGRDEFIVEVPLELFKQVSALLQAHRRRAGGLALAFGGGRGRSARDGCSRPWDAG
jgi:hypothetical protein